MIEGLHDFDGRLLEWKRIEEHGGYFEALLGDFKSGDGVRFSLSHRPTCYRRGQWRLLVEVAHGHAHHKWGCFDQDDQPERNYHVLGCALQEADELAKVLLKDRGARDAVVSP